MFVDVWEVEEAQRKAKREEAGRKKKKESRPLDVTLSRKLTGVVCVRVGERKRRSPKQRRGLFLPQ